MKFSHSAYLLMFILLQLAFHPVAFSHHDKQGWAKPIVDVTWLQSRASQDPSILIIDVRDEKSYSQGHIPDAINIPAEFSFNQNGDNTRIAPLNQIRNLFSDAGIKNSDYLVLYDDGSLKDAAHMYWVMETYGHRNVSVLDGGFPLWIQHAGKLTKNITKRAASSYIPSISPHHMSTKLTTRLAIENKSIAILDARLPDEYNGSTSKTVRAGHIPTAINIPWNSNFENPDASVRRLANPTKIQSIYAALGKPDAVITYCNRGKESAVSYLMLRQMNISVSVYDGAWLEWSVDNNMPVSKKPE